MLTIFRMCLVAAVAATALSAQARSSSHTFAWTHVDGSAVLTVNGSTDLTAKKRGWVSEIGENNFGDEDGNYLAGVCGDSDLDHWCGSSNLEYRNYFAFNLGAVDTVSSATLELYQPSEELNYYGDGFYAAGPLTYILWDVLMNPTVDSGTTLYADLGEGLSFGSVVLNSDSNGTMVTIVFNAYGIAMLQAAADAGGMAYMGGSVASAVPEPGSYALMLAGLGVIGYAGRRRHLRAAIQPQA